MNHTENLNLNKPEPAEQFNLDHWNSNMDIIDNAVQDEIDTRTSQIQTLTDDLSAEVNTRENAIIDAKNLDNATGILSVQKGGTGMATVQNALENLCSAIPTPENILATDNFMFKRNDAVKKMNLNNVANKIYDLIKVKIETTIPIGIIYPFCGEFGTVNDPYANVPAGYLACDGQAISRSQYANLFSVIGTKYGNGDEINTFNVPDFRECVPVGAGENTTVQIASHDVYAVGEFKDDQFQGHEHGNIKAGAGTYSYDKFGIAANENKDGRNGPSNTGSIITKEGYGTPRTGTTTHGKQIGVNYIIKY